jgi:hypothetical protein
MAAIDIIKKKKWPEIADKAITKIFMPGRANLIKDDPP